MVNNPLIRPYLLGGGSFGGGTLDSHDSGGYQFPMVHGYSLAMNSEVIFWGRLSYKMGTYQF